MVPPGYTALQEERLAMVELNSPKPETQQNGFHREGRRLSERSGDGRYGETEPMLPDDRLSGEEVEQEEESEEEGQQPATQNMPKESPLAMALQILVPFLLAGFGTVSAGMVLDIVQVSLMSIFMQVCKNCLQLNNLNQAVKLKSPILVLHFLMQIHSAFPTREERETGDRRKEMEVWRKIK